MEILLSSIGIMECTIIRCYIMIIAFVVNKTFRTIISDKLSYRFTTQIRLQDTTTSPFVIRNNTQDILVGFIFIPSNLSFYIYLS